MQVCQLINNIVFFSLVNRCDCSKDYHIEITGIHTHDRLSSMHISFIKKNHLLNQTKEYIINTIHQTRGPSFILRTH